VASRSSKKIFYLAIGSDLAIALCKYAPSIQLASVDGTLIWELAGGQKENRGCQQNVDWSFEEN